MQTYLKTIMASVVVIGLMLMQCSLVIGESATEQNLVENGDFSEGTSHWEILTTNPSAQVGAAIVSATAGPYKQAIQCVVTNSRDKNAANWTLNQQLNAKLTDEEFLVCKVWLRSPDGAYMNIIVDHPSHKARLRLLVARLDPTPEWKEYVLRGLSYKGLIDPDAKYQLRIPQGSGTVEIAGLRLYRRQGNDK